MDYEFTRFQNALYDFHDYSLLYEYENISNINYNADFPFCIVTDKCLKICEHEIAKRWCKEHAPQ